MYLMITRHYETNYDLKTTKTFNKALITCLHLTTLNPKKTICNKVTLPWLAIGRRQ